MDQNDKEKLGAADLILLGGCVVAAYAATTSLICKVMVALQKKK